MISQSCGESVYWIYDPNEKKLIIYGNGTMNNYKLNDNSLPWYSFKQEIETVEIEDGISSIGNYAFYISQKITSISLPESIISIEVVFLNNVIIYNQLQ